MKYLTRIQSIIIAFAIISALGNCGKDTQDDFSERTSTYLYDGDPTSSGRNRLSLNSANRIMLNSTVVTSTPALCGTTNSKSFIKSNVPYGTIYIGNDATDYYITVASISGWMLKEVKLFAGEETNIPVNPGNGAPQIGQYPISETFPVANSSSWSIKIPTSDLGTNFWVSSRVTFVYSDGNTQTVWSEGTLFNQVSAASKFECVQQDCIVNEGCAFGQGHWFGNGNQSWPDVNAATDGDITIGGETYTRDEARSVWSSNNGTCIGIPDAKKAFAFVAAISLSDTTVIGNGDLWNDIAAVDSWLASLDRLTDLNICNQPDAPVAIQEAIARIGAWIDAHHC